MNSGHDNKRKRGSVGRVECASPPARSSMRSRRAKSSQDGTASASDSPDSNKRQKKRSPVKTSPGASNPVRVSPRRSSRSKDMSDSPSGGNMAMTRGLLTPKKASPKKVAPRKVKSLVDQKPEYRKGYTSDGMSFESLPDDDLPDINIASPYKGKQYSKDDIVWAPFNTKDVRIYWPAVVTSVKGFHVCFLYINFYEKPVYRLHAKRLIPFDNPAKNSELKVLGTKTEGFKDAYDLVIKYYCSRKQNAALDARRFLTHTYDANDKVGLAKNCLFRLTGKLDSHTETKALEGVEEVEDLEIVSDKEVDDDDYDDGEEDENCKEEQKPESPQSERVREILEDLETLPSHMTVSSEQHLKMRKEAEELLGFIKSKDCFEHLMKIRQGTLESSRHKKFMKGERVQGGLGPFTLFNDLTDQFLSVLDRYCDDHDSFDYKHNVMIPEALFYAVMKLKMCPRLDAKKYFHKTCNQLGIRD